MARPEKPNDDLAHATEQLALSISRLATAIESRTGEDNTLKQILNRIIQTESNIMSAISDFSDRVTAKFDEISEGVDTVVTTQATQSTSITAIADDVAFLKKTIEDMNNSPGPISAEDQAKLDAAETRLGDLATKVAALKTGSTAVAEALAALDAATEEPPAPPTT